MKFKTSEKFCLTEVKILNVKHSTFTFHVHKNMNLHKYPIYAIARENIQMLSYRGIYLNREF